MEFLCSSQALDMIAPLKPSAGVAIAFESIRQQVPFAQEDRIFATDVKKICELIRTGVLVNAVESRVGSLEI